MCTSALCQSVISIGSSADVKLTLQLTGFNVVYWNGCSLGDRWSLGQFTSFFTKVSEERKNTTLLLVLMDLITCKKSQKCLNKHLVLLGGWGARDDEDDFRLWQKKVKIVWFLMEDIYTPPPCSLHLFFCSWHTGTLWTWVSDSPRKLLMKQFRCFDNPRHFLSSTFEFTSKQNLSRSTSSCSEVTPSTCRKVWPFKAFKAAFLLLHAYD